MPSFVHKKYDRRYPIEAASLRADDLRWLYNFLSEKAKDAAAIMVAPFTPNATMDQAAVDELKATVTAAHEVMVTVTGQNGETIVANDGGVLFDDKLPHSIATVFFDTGPKFVAEFKRDPDHRASLFLDFRKPRPLDWTRGPSEPTPNETNFHVVGLTEAWVAGTHQGLTEFFAARRKSSPWIHRRHSYDWLMFTIGAPLSFWMVFRIMGWIETKATIHSFLYGVISVYVALASFQLFRATFTYLRWMFPKLEYLSTQPGGETGQRVIFWGIVGSVVAALIYDAGKLLLP